MENIITPKMIDGAVWAMLENQCLDHAVGEA